jgi:cytochrome P450 family 2 subfamily J
VKKYGNIFSLNLGDITSVVITGLPLIKEALTQMEQNIMNRPLSVMQERISNKNGKFI